MAKPISDLVQSNRFQWKDEQNEVFWNLKQAFIARTVLALLKIGIPFIAI